jgi:hypothetical protein
MPQRSRNLARTDTPAPRAVTVDERGWARDFRYHDGALRQCALVSQRGAVSAHAVLWIRAVSGECTTVRLHDLQWATAVDFMEGNTVVEVYFLPLERVLNDPLHEELRRRLEASEYVGHDLARRSGLVCWLLSAYGVTFTALCGAADWSPGFRRYGRPPHGSPT